MARKKAPEPGVNEPDNNEGRRTDWLANQAKLEEFVFTEIQGYTREINGEKRKYPGRMPSWKEIEIGTGLSHSTICDHMKAMDLKKVFERTRLLGPQVALRQASKAISTGAASDVELYMKLNFGYRDKIGIEHSGSVDVEMNIAGAILYSEAKTQEEKDRFWKLFRESTADPANPNPKYRYEVKGDHEDMQLTPITK